jgi:SAM-dependent methyltransferase
MAKLTAIDMDKQGRGYQPGFYAHSEAVRDERRRLRKAAKIKLAFENFGANTGAFPYDGLCLDVGSSSGIMTAQITPLFGRTIGLDYDVTALGTIAPQDRALVDFLRGDAMCLPFPDQCVDAVICAQVYEHVPDDVQLFSEIYRVLKPGGLVFFSGPNWLFPVELHYNLPFLHWLPQAWANTLLRALGADEQYYEKSRHVWGLRQLMQRFEIYDATLDLVQSDTLIATPWLRQLAGLLPREAWTVLYPLLPNFNWILRKPQGDWPA